MRAASRNRHALALATVVITPTLVLPLPAFATDYDWKAAVSGNFADHTRWEPDGWPTALDTARIDRTDAPYTVTAAGASVASLVLDSPDATLQLGDGPGGELIVTDLQLKSGLLRTAGGTGIRDASAPVPLTITNAATIHIPSGSSLKLIGRERSSATSPVSTFVHAPGARLQIDGSLRLDRIWFMNHGGDFAGTGPITTDYADLSTRADVTHSDATFVVRGWSWLRAPEGYVNANPVGQTIVLRGNSDRLPERGEMRVDHGFINHGTIAMEVDPGTSNDWTYLKVFNTGTSPRGMTNAGTIITNHGPKVDGRREIWGDLLNRPGATVAANGNFRVSGAVRNEGTMTVAAGRAMSFGSLTQAAGSLDVRGTAGTADFAYQGGTITGGGTIYVGGAAGVALEWGNPALPVPDVTFAFRGLSHITKNIPTGYSVAARAESQHRDQTFTVGPDFTNHGSFRFEVAPNIQQPPVLKPTDAGSTELQRFINRGTFTVTRDSDYVSSGYVNRIDGHMLNAPGATAVIAGTTSVSGDVVNEGNFTIAAGKILRAGTPINDHGFVQAAGRLDVNGTLVVENHFTYRGGEITGNPIEIRGATLINDADVGSGRFIFAAVNLAPTPGRAAILAGQEFSSYPLASGTRIDGPLAWTNEGTIELGLSARLAAETSFNAADGRITNHGLIRLKESANISATLVNRGTLVHERGNAQVKSGFENTGTMSLGRDARLAVTGPTTNSGTITLGPSASLTFGDDVTNSGQFTLDATAYMDLTTASLLHRAADAATRDAAARHYTDLIRTERLRSPQAQSKPLTRLALAPVGETDLLIRITYNGDANLDGRINADDYFRIDQGFLAQPPDPLFSQGDFNYDGRVNADDYFLIDQAFLGQTGVLGIAMNAVAVPEPAGSLLLLGLPLALSRRTRRAGR